MKTVAIAIPALHRPDLTARCIEFIQQQTLPADEWEIVVVENEARPGDMLRDPLPPNTRRIELPVNEGTTGSINRAVAATESRYILLLNNDVELEPEYIAKLVAAMEADPKLGFATGKLLRATQRSYLDGAGDAMLAAGAGFRLGHMDPDNRQFDQTMPVLAGCGAAVLYRREAFLAAGGLDADFFAYLDDLDLALRAQLIGFGGLYMPDAVGYHIGSATLGESIGSQDQREPQLHPRVVELVTRNQLWLLTKDYPQPVVTQLLWRILAYQIMWMAFAARNGNLSAWWRGIRAAARGRSGMRAKRRELMRKRTIGDQEFLQRLHASEQQIWRWQQSRPVAERSSLLRLYFRMFSAAKDLR